MPTDPLAAVATRPDVVPQSQPLDPAQELNHAGGYTYTLPWAMRLLRFLILGTTGGTFYASEAEHTAEAAGEVIGIIREHGVAAVQLITDVSVSGRAPKQNPALWALAVAAGAPDLDTRQAALRALPAVARTGTHLFLFARYVEQHRGWGRSLRRAIAEWYTTPAVDDVAYQVVKYAQREGWSHRDLLRLAKPRRESYDGDPARRALLQWTAGKYDTAAEEAVGPLPRIVDGYLQAQSATDVRTWVRLIETYRLPWEALPDAALNEADVWRQLLLDLGPTALIRQLPRLSRLGLTDAASTRTLITERLTDPARLTRARVHPLQVLNALCAYRTGHARSGGDFRPHPQIVDALDAGFYAAFGAVEPVGGPVLLALDVSPSMFGATIAGTSLDAGQAAAAMALVTAATEPDYEIVVFASASTYGRNAGFNVSAQSRGVVSVPISPRQRLDDVVASLRGMSWGGTDCALPYLYALKEQRPVDLFVTYTDNETWAGNVHPPVALGNYRDRMSRPRAAGVVVGMTATRFTIADPKDSRMLDVVGFDTATPGLISAFGRGEL